MEESTTDAATQEPGAVTAQPEEQLAEAATTDSESTTPTDQPITEEAGVEPQTPDEDDLSDYLAKKGIDLSTPEGQAKLARSYREAEKAMHNKAQQASELEKQINSQPLNVDTDNEMVRQFAERQAALETTIQVQQWKASKQITPEQDAALGQYLTDNPNVGLLLKNGYLNLDQLYNMSGVGTPDVSAAKKQGGKEALQNIASQQRAAVVPGSATRQAPKTEESGVASIWANDD